MSVVAGDDFWAKDKLANELALFSNDFQCVYSACAFTNEKGERTGQFKREYDGDEGDVIFQMLMHEMAFRNPLLKMSLIREVGFYNEKLEIFEDWQFKIEYLAKVNVAFSFEETVFYRNHPNGISKLSSSETYYTCLKSVYKNVRAYINKLPPVQKGAVLKRKKCDLLRHLNATLEHETELPLWKKLKYSIDAAILKI